MKAKYIVSLLVLASSMSVMAEHHTPCAPIAKACTAGGYTKAEGAKNIWIHCMKPVMLGQTVKGITVDPTVVKNCRMDKIKEMKKELKEFEKVS